MCREPDRGAPQGSEGGARADTPVTDDPRVRRHRLNGLALFVALAAGCLAGFFGRVAAALYDVPGGGVRSAAAPWLPAIGGVWGAATGLIAAAIWCRLVFRDVDRGKRSGLASRGAGLGLWVGALSTILLHAVLLVAGDALHRYGPEALLATVLGLVFGLPSGGILGLISGAICQRLVWPASRQL